MGYFKKYHFSLESQGKNAILIYKSAKCIFLSLYYEFFVFYVAEWISCREKWGEEGHDQAIPEK